MHCSLTPCFFLFDISNLDKAITEVGSTFPFTLSELMALELSHERLDGIFYWQERVEALADAIEKEASGG